MSDPVTVMLAIDAGAVSLDELEKLHKTATGTLDEAEEAWLEHRDKIAEDLKDQMHEEGRKGDPAEHWIDSQARRADRLKYTNLRRAERAVKSIEARAKIVSQAMNGRQSELSAMRDELRAGQYRPQPQGQTYGGRAA